MNKKILGIVAAAAIVIVGGAFFLKNSNNEGDKAKGGNIEITHKLGTTKLEKTPEKVVVLDFGALDVLDSLGANIVGLPKSGKLPEYLSKYSADQYTNVGTVKEPDLEAINELKPDLIVMAGRMEDYYGQFSEIAPTVFFDAYSTEYIEGFNSNLKMFGEIFNEEEKAEKMTKEVAKKVEEANKAITESGKNASIINLSGRNISAFSKVSRYSFLFNELGFKQADENLQDSTHGQEVSFEYLVEKNPDYLFVIDRNSVTGTDAGQSSKEIIENELVKQTDAYKNGNIVYLNAVNWYTVAAGYQSTIGMADEVINAIK